MLGHRGTAAAPEPRHDMLTKSAAKAFFLGGTALCSLAFVLLTVDTLGQFPDRSHEDQLSESAIRGHRIWTRNNCMGCHTILGEGAYYAPELTRVVDRRSDTWIRQFLADPAAFFPGRRQMVKYAIFDPADVGAEEAARNVDDVLAFLHWISGIDTNGFPATPDLAGAPTANLLAGEVAPGSPEYFRTVCIGCHAVDGRGGVVGPALDGVADRFDAGYLSKWITDPQSVKPGTTMPTLGLDQALIGELVDYLGTLSEAN